MKKFIFFGLVCSLLVGVVNVASAFVLGEVPAEIKKELQEKPEIPPEEKRGKEPQEKPETALTEETRKKHLQEKLEKAIENIGFKVKPSITLPAFKIYKSKKENTIADVAVMSGIGGGVSLVWYDKKNSIATPLNSKTDVKLKSYFTFSPMTVLLRKEAEKGSIDLSYAMTAGFFDDILMIGIGYDLGEVKDRNRLFLLLSIGANF